LLLKYGIKYSDLFSTGTRSALDVKAGLLKSTRSWLKKSRHARRNFQCTLTSGQG